MRNGQKCNTTVNQPRMTLCIWFWSESAVSIATGHNEIHCPVHIDDLRFVLVKEVGKLRSGINKLKQACKNRNDGQLRHNCLTFGPNVELVSKTTYSCSCPSRIEKCLTISASMATAQKENRVSISPHLSPKKLPSGCCNEATNLATASRSTSSKAS